ncbi:hypothetical protein BO79DRAFT_13075 [Aspergillus costaricaensis CBS 115574]|uniref:Uncharacterized protein n=1 Tax=Aspergillus costaricaensis CBS 115574 TaxID=1448317 RepID=A0ACD1IGS8_9EURO|nr:hypothetical protein BO79DRAFT_13075 [Aspergillus costaricaensis CBS 115574]RAK89233.1 hypothetical protein BO79DRAFT_13075 [Aspergillus costaricaensis CBS 115574]
MTRASEAKIKQLRNTARISFCEVFLITTTFQLATYLIQPFFFCSRYYNCLSYTLSIFIP